MAPVRTYVVDDHEVVRSGVAHALPGPEFAVVGASGTARTTRQDLARDLDVDVLVVDVGLPDGSGLDLLHHVRLHHPATRALVFTALVDPRLALAAIVCGASGLLPKGATPDDLRQAVRQAAQGDQLLTIPEILTTADPPLPADRLQHVTAQEGRLLGLLVRGLTNQQIAEATDLAEKTVRNHVSRLLAKTGLENRTQLTAYVLGAISRVTWTPTPQSADGPRALR